MKRCHCGGEYHRHGAIKSKHRGEAQRYRCKTCGSCITVRDGKLAHNRGARINDWRMS